jgi:hypothetical protein
MDSRDSEHTESPEIPLLEDIVRPDEIGSDAEAIEFEGMMPATSSPDLSQPAMREAIAEQLLQDLKPIVADAVESAISETVKRIDEMLHDELDSPLEHRIQCLIEEQLDKRFGPRNN